MASLTDFRNKLTGGGARANQFSVRINSPFIQDVEALSFLCRSASLPAMTIGEVPVFYRGRQIYVAGDRTYADWTVTVTMMAVGLLVVIWKIGTMRCKISVTLQLVPKTHHSTMVQYRFSSWIEVITSFVMLCCKTLGQLTLLR